MARTLTSYRTRFLVGASTPQTQPIPGEVQVANSAGGFSYKISPMQQLTRFLILGTTGGTYYASEKELTKTNAQDIKQLIETDGLAVVQHVVDISVEGRAPKADPGLFVLAMAISFGDAATKRSVVAALPKVARIGTHLFLFVQFAEQFRGWGRVLRDAVANWYTSQGASQLAYQVIKYQQREGWSHKDLLRLSHAHAPNKGSGQDEVLHWVARGWDDIGPDPAQGPLEKIWAFEKAKRATTAKEIVELIRDYDLPRECIPTQFLKDTSVWDALLQKMPMTAMIRNLTTMSRVGLLVPMSDASRIIAERLQNDEIIRKARIHPIQVLSALRVYKNGGRPSYYSRSKGEPFTPVSVVSTALERAFYKSFGFVEPSGKRTLLALDVSGSMDGGEVAGIPGLTPRDASVAMAMVTARSEWSEGRISVPMYQAVAFTDTLTPIDLSPAESLEAVTAKVSRLNFGRTDCAQPMLYAIDKKLDVDTFVVYTDNETYAGRVHPSQALDQYRKKFREDAKLVVVGMTSTGFSIARPGDAGMLDVVGMDTATPRLITEFSQGKV
jgi:60 kDa SS-A/Ro ribonucleoprotein